MQCFKIHEMLSRVQERYCERQVFQRWLKLGLDQTPPNQKWTSAPLYQSPQGLELHLLLTKLNLIHGALKITGS